MNQPRRYILLATVCAVWLCLAAACGSDLNTELHKAVENGDAREAQNLIDQGADVNHQQGGLTPLMRAALKGDVEMSKTLLDARADVTAANAAGKTAFDYAVERGNKGVATLIGTRRLIDSLQKEFEGSPVATAPPGAILSLHNPNGQGVPVALEIWDLHDAEDAVEKGRTFDAAQLIKTGRIFMVPNGSEVTVLDRQLRISKVRIRKSGREGYVLNRLIR